MPTEQAHYHTPEDRSQLQIVSTWRVVSHAQLDRLAPVGSVSLQFLWVTHQMYELKG